MPQPDPGYRIAERVARRGNRRAAAVVAALTLAVGGAIALAAFRVRLREPIADTTQSPAASVVQGPIATRLPTLYQPVQLADPIPPIPVLSGGLRWLDAGRGIVSGPPFSIARGWVFAGSDGGAVCVCDDSPGAQAGSAGRTTVVRYGPDGSELARAVIPDSERDAEARPADAILDATRSADGRYVYVAALIPDASGWHVQLRQISLEPTPAFVESLALGHLQRAPSGTLVYPPVVRAAPDGRRIRVSVRSDDRGGLGGGMPIDESVWIVWTGQDDVISNRGEMAFRQGPVTTEACVESWVTATTYARLCGEQRGDSIVPVAHLQEILGPDRSIEVGDRAGADDLDWLVDARFGVIYRWSHRSHTVAKLDAATGQVTESILGAEVGNAPPFGQRPKTRPGRAIWGPLGSAAEIAQPRLAGSVDGSLLYAIGSRSGTAPDPSEQQLGSTGVFVFDAATLDLLGHWPAAAAYDAIGVSPDGRYVLAIGRAGMTANGSPASWPRSLAIHDGWTGQLVEQLAPASDDGGSFVDLLVPGPVP